MDDLTLPERLRALHDGAPRGATRVAVPHDVVLAAADKIERLARPPDRKGLRLLLADLGELAQYIVHGAAQRRDWRAIVLDARSELVRLAGECERLERLAYPMLAPGTAAKVAERLTPSTRRFAAHYPEGWRTPSPGSFVYAGPALAVWRVLSVEERVGATRDADDPNVTPANATHTIELEPVDAHDVPTLARVETIPDPLPELDPEPVSS